MLEDVGSIRVCWLATAEPRNTGAIQCLFLLVAPVVFVLRRRLAACSVIPLPAAFCPAIFLSTCGLQGSWRCCHTKTGCFIYVHNLYSHYIITIDQLRGSTCTSCLSHKHLYHLQTWNFNAYIKEDLNPSCSLSNRISSFLQRRGGQVDGKLLFFPVSPIPKHGTGIRLWLLMWHRSNSHSFWQVIHQELPL